MVKSNCKKHVSWIPDENYCQYCDEEKVARETERRELFKQVALACIPKLRQGEALDGKYLTEQTEAILAAANDFAIKEKEYD